MRSCPPRSPFAPLQSSMAVRHQGSLYSLSPGVANISSDRNAYHSSSLYGASFGGNIPSLPLRPISYARDFCRRSPGAVAGLQLCRITDGGSSLVPVPGGGCHSPANTPETPDTHTACGRVALSQGRVRDIPLGHRPTGAHIPPSTVSRPVVRAGRV
ncbi:hypothetical protein C8F04DRAFT_639485 [Mycena alexandri]|uniref:Uncharacterized protein n=1 Tax=Mycena alexandri TaxID=1745969 RepID=A0AAD6SSK8_9AGAR|nr:hypothetical protein C8F04DRAFT_639485 [Mycena alexandri]